MCANENKPKEVLTHCPTCGGDVIWRGSSEGTYFPFCSKRCQMIDLGHWFDGDYSLSRPIDPEKDEDELEQFKDNL